MTTTLSWGDIVVGEITDISTPTFAETSKRAGESLQELTAGVSSFSFKIECSKTSLEELKAQLDRLSKPQKPKITDRQIFKMMRVRGIW